MYAAVDVGGTKLKIGLFKSLEKPEIIRLAEYQTMKDYRIDLGNITDCIKKLTSEKIKGIGVGLPGILNKERDTILMLPNLTEWNHMPLKKDLEKSFDCKVVLENDATCAALGEALYGDDNDRFLFLIWGTGIGGSEVERVDKTIHISRFEPGHEIIEIDGRPCKCGQNGCLEAYIGGNSIQNIFEKDVRDLDDDEWNQVTDTFAQGLVNIIAIRPTSLIVYGGGVAVNQPAKIELIHKKVGMKLKNMMTPDMKISKLGHDAGLFGALGLLTGKKYD